MKVLYLTSWYPTSVNPNFGGFIKEHAKVIKSAGVEIQVLALIIYKSTALFKLEIDNYTDEYEIPTTKLIISSKFAGFLQYAIPLQFVILWRQFSAKIKPNFVPDLIHSNIIFPAGILGYLLSKQINKPLIITEHWSKLGTISKKPYISHMAKKTYLHAKKIFAVSEFLKTRILFNFPDIKADKIDILPNLIDSEIFYYKEKSISNANTFCAIADWSIKKNPDKKPELFIEALAKVEKDLNEDLNLIIIGGGNMLPEMKKRCNELGINATFTGYIQKDSIAKLLRDSDFFIHASLIETFGIVVVEALMTGTPVICSNVGALPELITEANGILCENTIESWVAGIKKAITIPFNNQEIAEKVSNKYSALKIGELIKNIYTDILK